MSDSFIAILGMGFLVGASVTLIILGAIYGSDKRQHDIDLDMRVYVPSRDRDRSRNNRPDISDKELAAMLRAICATGICPSRNEKEYLREAADRLEEMESEV